MKKYLSTFTFQGKEYPMNTLVKLKKYPKFQTGNWQSTGMAIVTSCWTDEAGCYNIQYKKESQNFYGGKLWTCHTHYKKPDELFESVEPIDYYNEPIENWQNMVPPEEFISILSQLHYRNNITNKDCGKELVESFKCVNKREDIDVIVFIIFMIVMWGALVIKDGYVCIAVQIVASVVYWTWKICRYFDIKL